MRYQEEEVQVEKTCILSARFVPTNVFIQKLEDDLVFRGGEVHCDAKYNNTKITVYRPSLFVGGTETLVRVLVKKVDNYKYYKIVFIPQSDKMDEGIDLPAPILVGQLAKLCGACEGAARAWISSVEGADV